MKNQFQSRYTSKGHKAMKFLTFMLSILLGMALLLAGQSVIREFKTSETTVILKQSVQPPCVREKRCGVGTVIPSQNPTANTTASGQSFRSEMDSYGPYRGVVDLAHDGDTVNVKLDVGFDLTIYARVRIKGINAPELSMAAGKTARDFAQSVMPPGTSVFVTSYGWDKYGGRIDGSITLVTPYAYNGKPYTNFAQLMLDSGNAVVYNP